jgi:hypothetical protein
MSPLAGPLAWSTGVLDARTQAVTWRVAQMTLYPFSFFSFFSLQTSQAPLAGSPGVAGAAGTRRRGGGS